MTRRAPYPFTLAVLMLLLSACGGGAEETTAEEAPAEDAAAEETAAAEEGGAVSTEGAATEGESGGAGVSEDLIAAAEEEGEMVWYTAIPTEASEAVAAAFSEKYPGIDAQVVRSPSFELWERFRTENAAGANIADAFSPSDYGVITMAKDQGLISTYIPESIEGVVEDQFIDPEDYYWSNRITTTSIIYNTDEVPADQAPEQWEDLLDPFWQGKLGIGDPQESAAIYGAYWEMANSDEIGPEFFQGLAELDPILYAQGGQQLNAVTTGEIIGTIVVDYRGWQLMADGAPVEIVYPDEGVGYTLDFNAVAENAPHPNAAQLFMEFLGSEEGASVLAANLGSYLTQPVDSYPMADERPQLSEINLLPIDLDQMAADFESFNSQFDEWIGR